MQAVGGIQVVSHTKTALAQINEFYLCVHEKVEEVGQTQNGRHALEYQQCNIYAHIIMKI